MRGALMKSKVRPIGGYSKFPNALVRNLCQLSNPALRLLLVVYSYRRAFPSYREIQRQTGMSRASIAKAKAELEVMCIISVEAGNERRASNLYKLRPMQEWKLKNFEPPHDSESELVQFKDHGGGSSNSVPSLVPDPDTRQSKESQAILRKNNHQPPSVEMDGTSFLRRKQKTFETINTAKLTGLPAAYLQTSPGEHLSRRFWGSLKKAFDGNRYFSEVPSVLHDGIVNDGQRIDLQELIDFCAGNLNGKRAEKSDRFLEDIRNRYYVAYEEAEELVRAEVARKDSDELSRSLVDVSFGESTTSDFGDQDDDDSEYEDSSSALVNEEEETNECDDADEDPFGEGLRPSAVKELPDFQDEESEDTGEVGCDEQ